MAQKVNVILEVGIYGRAKWVEKTNERGEAFKTIIFTSNEWTFIKTTSE